MTTIIGLCGSLRHGSFNRMLLRAAVEVAPPGRPSNLSPFERSRSTMAMSRRSRACPPPSSDSRTGSLKQMAY